MFDMTKETWAFHNIYKTGIGIVKHGNPNGIASGDDVDNF